jgi:hypothetical protein
MKKNNSAQGLIFGSSEIYVRQIIVNNLESHWNLTFSDVSITFGQMRFLKQNNNLIRLAMTKILEISNLKP